jgi:hypothetical protein
MSTNTEPPKASDRQLAISGNWAIATDGVQWILQRRKDIDRRNGRVVWRAVSFVRSTKDILARCMREKGCPQNDAQSLLQLVASDPLEKRLKPRAPPFRWR